MGETRETPMPPLFFTGSQDDGLAPLEQEVVTFVKSDPKGAGLPTVAYTSARSSVAANSGVGGGLVCKSTISR